MVKTGRNVAVALAAIGALIGSPRTSAAADAEALTNTMRTSSHVRSVSPAIESLIAQATEGSATFRRLVEDIDASDSYVYVNEGHCRPRRARLLRHGNDSSRNCARGALMRKFAVQQ